MKPMSFTFQQILTKQTACFVGQKLFSFGMALQSLDPHGENRREHPSLATVSLNWKHIDWVDLLN